MFVRYVIVLYDAPVPASVAVRSLLAAGFPRADITMLPALEQAGEDDWSRADIVRRLQERGVSAHEAALYAEGVRRGGTLVEVACPTVRTHEALQCLNALGAVDIVEHAALWERTPQGASSSKWQWTRPRRPSASDDSLPDGDADSTSDESPFWRATRSRHDDLPGRE